MAKTYSRPKNPRLTTPKGRALYPRLTEADTKYNKLGQYNCRLVVPSKDAKAFITTVEAFLKAKAEENGIEIGGRPYTQELDDNKKPSGNIIINCKADNVVTKTKEVWDKKPVIFDTHGDRLEDVNIGNGSLLAVNVELVPTTYQSQQYCKLDIKAVQVHELVEYGGGSASSYGFEVKEKEENNGVETNDASEDEDLF